MATLIRMPEVAAAATHVTLAAWTKKEGDAVHAGECFAEAETDKAVIELTSDADGIMGKQLIGPGKEVEVGAPIAVLLAAGEADVDVDALIAMADGMPVESSRNPVPDALVAPSSADMPIDQEGAAAGRTRTFVSPLAHRLAKQQGIDLAALQGKGSGPNGRIVKHDIESAAASAEHAKEAASTSPTAGHAEAAASTAPTGSPGGLIEIPHSSMRKAIARRLSESKTTVPHFYLSADCRMDRLLALRAEINANAARKISVNDFVVRAVAVALREVPQANVSWSDTAMLHYDQADIAVAVSTESGLLTPIVRNADQKTLSCISAEIAELAIRARAGKLHPEEYQGGSFSVSNLGMFGVDEFAAIINPPQAMILAIGATKQVPVVENGGLMIGSVMRVTLSADHRAIDGALAAQWLAAFRRFIEVPLSMLV